ncbi:MAG: hypothetical protein IPG11_08370 [Flavobacteriales bacterium]|nr:hypothetical protein [Flavobacteriales bacterium]
MDDRFFRSINLFHTFLIEKQCDSASAELDRLYSFVEQEGAKQLSVTDLDYNRHAVLIDCYGLADSARSWAESKHLKVPSTGVGM